MFQKLYRHLEEVNATLRRQEDAINANALYGPEIVRNLEAIIEHAQVNQKYMQRTLKNFPAVVAGAFLILLLLSVGSIVILNIRLSRLTNEIAGSERAAQRQMQSDLQKDRHLQYFMGRQQEMAVQLVRLDSVIFQQGESLLQLKDLNLVSAQAFIQIKNKIDQTNRLIKTLQADSGRDVGAVNTDQIRN